MPDELDAATLLDHAWPEPIPVCYNRRDLLLYALGIGCDELCFVHEDSSAFAAFPTYPAVLGFKGDALDVVSFPSPAMMQSPMPFLPGTRVILDAERYIERVRPLQTEGGSLQLRTKLVGVLPKGKGALLQTESELSDASGTLLYRMQAASFAVGAKGFKGAGVSQDTVLAHMWASIRTLRFADGPDEVHSRAIAREEFGKYADLKQKLPGMR